MPAAGNSAASVKDHDAYTPAVAALLADPHATDRFLDRIPLRRVGTAAEIAISYRDIA